MFMPSDKNTVPSAIPHIIQRDASSTEIMERQLPNSADNAPPITNCIRYGSI